jgi:hypothetical protein
MSENLAALAAKLSKVLAIKPECFITHPAELQVFKTMSREALNEFAAERGWRVVCRVGERQMEFYNDAGARGDL